MDFFLVKQGMIETGDVGDVFRSEEMGVAIHDRAAARLAAAAPSLRAGSEKSCAMGQALTSTGPWVEEIESASPASRAIAK